MSIRKQKHIFRTICMTMLLLIHCDAYAYELVSFFFSGKGTEVSFYQMETSKLELDSEGMEWSELAYKSGTIRHRLLLKASPMPLLVGEPLLLIRHHIKCSIRYPFLTVFPWECTDPQHLRYCTLLI